MKKDISDSVLATADYLLLHCGTLRPGERVIVVCDEQTEVLAELLAERAGRLATAEVKRVPEAAMHGAEPPQVVAEALAGADLILGLTTLSMAHTHARKRAAAAGARYLSLPDYSLELMADPSLRADYRGRRGITERLTGLFSAGQRLEIKTRAGTDIVLDAGDRVGNCCPGYVEAGGDLGSPPDIEANVSPLETASEGVVVVDGSIPCAELGLLVQPVTLQVAGGRIVDFHGPAETVATLQRLFREANSERAYVLAEFGVGLNELAVLTGKMLTDEGAMGTAHFGFGSNATVGGLNDVSFHLDFVFRSPSLWVDGQQAIKDGEVLV